MKAKQNESHLGLDELSDVGMLMSIFKGTESTDDVELSTCLRFGVSGN
jgi:hypothetical protein